MRSFQVKSLLFPEVSFEFVYGFKQQCDLILVGQTLGPDHLGRVNHVGVTNVAPDHALRLLVLVRSAVLPSRLVSIACSTGAGH